ncbi:MAG: succinyldiaminopimelate transaminase [Methylococcaceae bacterium]|nr:succinyldiaminopimelate transaminase [Methylococcaceae bacterium]
MTPHLKNLHAYPFERLAQLKAGVVPPSDKSAIVLSIGEPAHATPPFISAALQAHSAGLSKYPTTKGIPELRQAIAAWLATRYQIPEDNLDAETQILPVSGTREALFSFAQCVLDASAKPIVIMPNPFYQIYEGAALLAGAEPYFLATPEANGYLPDFDSVPTDVWQRCQLLYICSPGNPCGAIISSARHEQLIRLAEQYDFVIASDECYSELYDDESQPPVGLLQSAYNMGNTDFKRCVVFHSLSKRSNAPGLRSGFVAGDAEILQAYFQYRTYQGCALPVPTQYASITAWQDEQHVVENRRLYREKFAAVIDILKDTADIQKPPAGFYIWLKTPIADTDFAQQLFAQENVTVLPGSFLSRDFHGQNPGQNHVRIALVAPLSDCVAAAVRIKHFLNTLK